ncbi:GcrA family cell cycle regulator [Alsobacter sp. KACC 23698]|uniref:GcrA family cell cycle regulator n=1 Tax=Alsobacter sp. KACC 23698 TaxID=3149229 RepID=A0AAU7J8U2_9HYPH
MAVPWTDDRVEILRKLIVLGLSASQVAAELGGGVTRSSVIGKAFRLGLNFGAAKAEQDKRIVAAAAGRRGRSVQLRRAALTVVTPSASGRDASHAPKLGGASKVAAGATFNPEPPPLPSPPLGLSLLALTADSCRYPVALSQSGSHQFCGHTHEGAGPYCPHHAAIAYRGKVKDAPKVNRRDTPKKPVLSAFNLSGVA